MTIAFQFVLERSTRFARIGCSIRQQAKTGLVFTGKPRTEPKGINDGCRRKTQGADQNQIFQSLQPAELDAVLARATPRRIARGEIIRRQGDPGTGMVIIVSGRVRISLVSEDGREVTLTMLGPGEVLGEMTLLDGAVNAAPTRPLKRIAVC